MLQVKVTFDGDKCVYEGPRVFLDGTEVRFEFAPTAAMAPTSALVVGPVIEGMSRDQVEEDLQGHPASVPPTWLMSWSSSYGPGTFIHTMSRTEESKPVGGYVVACLTSPETTDATYFTELLLVAGS